MKFPGYNDTPLVPGSSYHVHDGDRPAPRVVTPGEGGGPPSDAIVLFGGADLSNWVHGDGRPAEWWVFEGCLEVNAGSGDIHTREEFGSCQLHVEWRAPHEVRGDSQGRGNSGVFLMGAYEFQVLDCYDNPTYADGTAGAIYGQFPPLVNACRRPGEWQAYDIIWEAPAFEGDRVARPAYATVLLNGLLVHHRVELQGATGHRNVPGYAAHTATGPLKLQDHGDKVRFRNIWYRPLTGYDKG